MSLFAQFATNKNSEVEGVFVDFGSARIRIARAGGANNAYLKRMQSLVKPHRKSIQAGTIDNDVMRKLTVRAYAETVITSWETPNDKGEWFVGVPNRDGAILPFEVDNVVEILEELPDLFDQIVEYANSSDLFNEVNLEYAAKNS